MDQNKPEPTLEESIKQVMQTLPPVIRAYLAQGKYTPVAKSLMTKYALRIDQGGVLEREIMLMLMGIETPEEFTKALADEAKLTPQTVNGIVQDINAQIFMPLREQMRKGPTVVAKPTTPAASVARGLISTDATQPPHFFHLENKLPPRLAEASSVGGLKPVSSIIQPPVTPRPAVVATPSTLAQAIGNALSAVPKVAPQQPRPAEASSVVGPRPSSNIAPLPPKFMVPKTLGSQASPEPRKMLEDHEEPHIELSGSPIIPKVEPQARVVLPPPNLPGAMPPLPVPGVQSSPAVSEVHTLPIESRLVSSTKAAPIAPATPIKSYTTDPYREPIE